MKEMYFQLQIKRSLVTLLLCILLQNYLFLMIKQWTAKKPSKHYD